MLLQQALDQLSHAWTDFWLCVCVYIYLVGVNECGCAHAQVFVWRSEDNLCETVSRFQGRNFVVSDFVVSDQPFGWP